MFWITKKNIKGLPKKLRTTVNEILNKPSNNKIYELQEILSKIIEIFNSKEFKRDDLPNILNTKLYRDHTIESIIKLMPLFDHYTNNLVSSFLQFSEREFAGTKTNLPNYLIQHEQALSTLFSYIDDQNLFSISNIIIRECLSEESFLVYLYEHHYVSSFLRFLNGDNFELLTSAFKTFEMMLMTNKEISSQFILNDYDIFALEMKVLLASPNYITQMIILPLITNFITAEPCRAILMNFVSDADNMCLIMPHLGSKSKKVRLSAYYLFKLFVINPRRNQNIRKILRKNKDKLTRIIRRLSFPDDDEELNEERITVIQNLSS